jgi:hypothetical protein
VLKIHRSGHDITSKQLAARGIKIRLASSWPFLPPQPPPLRRRRNGGMPAAFESPLPRGLATQTPRPGLVWPNAHRPRSTGGGRPSGTDMERVAEQRYRHEARGRCSYDRVLPKSASPTGNQRLPLPLLLAPGRATEIRFRFNSQYPGLVQKEAR